jgi:predicted nucleic-acid-binding Zn-ribbon protein
MENLEKVDTCSYCGSQFNIPIAKYILVTCLKCGYRFEYAYGEKVSTRPPMTTNELIKETSIYLKRIVAIFVALFIISGVVTIFLSEADYVILLYVWLLALFSCIYSAVKELWLFNYSFLNPDRLLIDWSYSNGDRLVVGCWGLLKKNTFVPPLLISHKFEGFKWELDNVKELTESLLEHKGSPLMALMPSIEFSTTKNRVDDYIFFDTGDKVKLTFIDKDNGYLIINIEKKNKKYKLTYPLPPSKESLGAEAKVFEQRIFKRRTRISALYLERSVVDKILIQTHES